MAGALGPTDPTGPTGSRSAQTPGSGGYTGPTGTTGPLQYRPKRGAFAELQTRHRDLMGLCDRLETLARPIRGRWYAPAGWATWGAAVGALVGGVTVFGATSGEATWAKPVYGAAIVLILVGALLMHASRSVQDQRTDSIAQIHKEFRALMDEYELEDEQG